MQSSSTFIQISGPNPKVKTALIDDYENIAPYSEQSQQSEVQVNRCRLLLIYLGGLRVGATLEQYDSRGYQDQFYTFFLQENFTSIKSIKTIKTLNKRTKTKKATFFMLIKTSKRNKVTCFTFCAFCAFYAHKNILFACFTFCANKKQLRKKKLLFMLFVLINNILCS